MRKLALNSGVYTDCLYPRSPSSASCYQGIGASWEALNTYDHHHIVVVKIPESTVVTP